MTHDSSDFDAPRATISRRTMLARSSAGMITIFGGGLLAACGGDDTSGTASSTAPTGTAGTPTTDPTGSTAAPATAPAVTASSAADATTTTVAPEPAEITQLLTTPGPSFANALTAIASEMGFFENEALDVKLEYPGNSVRALQTIVAGTGTVSSADSFALLVATAEQLDLRSIYLTSRGYVFGFAVRADSAIQDWSVDSVRGAKIGITEFGGGEVPVLRGALARLGLGEGVEGVEFVPIGGGGAETADAIESGKVDLFAASVLDFEIFKAAGVDLRLITPDYIQNFPGIGIATTPEILEANRGPIVRHLRATAMATVFLHANPTAAAEISMAAAPESSEGVPIELVEGLLTSLLADGNDFAFEEGNPDFHRLGVQDPAAYDNYQKFLIETGSADDDGTTLTAEVDVASIIDNSLIDEVNDFDYDEIRALAENA